MDLSIEHLLLLITDDALNTRSEEPIWEFCLRWIERDENNRIEYIPRLLEGIRLGLMSKDVGHIIITILFIKRFQSDFLLILQYFEQRVVNHNYVQSCPAAKPITTIAHKFVNNMDDIDWLNDRDIDISLLVPRLPPGKIQ